MAQVMEPNVWKIRFFEQTLEGSDYVACKERRPSMAAEDQFLVAPRCTRTQPLVELSRLVDLAAPARRPTLPHRTAWLHCSRYAAARTRRTTASGHAKRAATLLRPRACPMGSVPPVLAVVRSSGRADTATTHLGHSRHRQDRSRPSTRRSAAQLGARTPDAHTTGWPSPGSSHSSSRLP